MPTEANVLTPEKTEPCCGTDCCSDTVTDTAVVEEKADVIAETAEEIKATVREKYGQIAVESGSCCGPTSCGCGDTSLVGDAYQDIEGYVADADLSLGCGLPTEHANLQAGQTVLDLGSGAGLDAFVARKIVGEEGRIIGVDMTPEMITKARANTEQLGYDNVDFYLGEIEALPIERETVDVVVSNCVLNLVPDKAKAFSEMYRVIKPGGHFTVSDVVVRGDLPAAVRRSAELYVGCVAGAVDVDTYLTGIRDAGFSDVRIVQEKVIDMPDSALIDLFSPEQYEAYKRSNSAVLSITVYGQKT